MSNTNKPARASIYVREIPSGRRRPGRVVAVEYALKFDGFIQAAAVNAAGEENAADTLIIDHPGVLGDTLEELLQSLSLLAEAGLTLAIVNAQPNTHRLARLDQLGRARRASSTPALPARARRRTE